MSDFNTPRNASEAGLLIRVEERAARITEDYRLHYSSFDKCFYVTHKQDRTRRYRVTARSCSCPFCQQHGDCKHLKGLALLCDVEVKRYTILRMPEKRQQVIDLLDEIEDMKWEDPEYLNTMVELFGNQ